MSDLIIASERDTTSKKAKPFKVKEIFYSLQGEGAHSGRPAVFCRFSKCNLWNGREDSRADSICNFCDTDFVGTDGQNGGVYQTQELVDKISSMWPQDSHGNLLNKPYVIFTGGEPLLQLNEVLVDAFKQAGFETAVETNGTLEAPQNLDWICVSPKGTAEVILNKCNELKLVYPQVDAMPEKYVHIIADHYYLQPMADCSGEHGKNLNRDTMQRTVEYCLANPKWSLSVQSQKTLNID